MRDFVEQVFKLADLQVFRSLLIHEIGDEDEIDRRSYERKLREESAPMKRFLECTYPDGEERDAAFDDISRAITAYQEVYFDMGVKCGARLLYQLLIQQNPEEL